MQPYADGSRGDCEVCYMHCLKTGVCPVPAAEGPRLPYMFLKGASNGAHNPNQILSQAKLSPIAACHRRQTRECQCRSVWVPLDSGF